MKFLNMIKRIHKAIFIGIILGIIGMILSVYVYPKYNYYSANAKLFMMILSIILFVFSIYKPTFSTKIDILFYQRLEKNKLIKINNYIFFVLILIIVFIYSALTFKEQTDYFRTVIIS